MKRHLGLALVVALALLATLPITGSGGATSASATAQQCVPDPSQRLPEVPSPEEEFGFPLGIGQTQLVTTDQSDAYVAKVDASSDRVISASMGNTASTGRPLKYAIVSSEENMDRLDKIVDLIQSLRDPREVKQKLADKIAEDTPTIVWDSANIHGGEKSGLDASLQVLYELASRTDCEVSAVNDNVVTVIQPSQNPDGRDDNRRQNDYGFDLNRDWFARTQVETDVKLDVVEEYPPQVFMDVHEMGGRQYFFPPNADPIHHEIADESVTWINEIGEANKAGFNYNGACGPGVTTECYFNYDIYDLYFMGYGDTVPSTAYGAAGMTYEKGSSSPIPLRVDQQLRTQWATIGWASDNRERLLRDYHGIYKDALVQGEQGLLEPNEVLQPGNEVQFEVPDIKIRSYFLLSDRNLGDVRKMVERLRSFDVEVYRTNKQTTVPNARLMGGDSASNVVVPRGSYWIPMAQPQKHWIQAIMGEDGYAPFAYFYDVSSWSNPLLMGINTVFTGDDLKPASTPVKKPDGGAPKTKGRNKVYSYPLDSSQAAALTFMLLGEGYELYRDLALNEVSFEPRGDSRVLDEFATTYGIDVEAANGVTRGTPLHMPSIGLFEGSGVSFAGSHGEARYIFEQRWGTSAAPVTATDINTNSAALQALDVLVVPDGSSSTGGLTAVGLTNLRQWVSDGGIYIGLRRQGTRMARNALLTSTTEMAPPPGYIVPGAHFRVNTSDGSPVGLGRPVEDFQFNNLDPILSFSTTGINVQTYPTGARFWHNGFTENESALEGTATVVDEPVGSGHAVLFSYNALFRAYEESGEHLFANAVLYPSSAPEAAGVTNLRSAAGRSEARTADAAAVEANLGGDWRPIQIAVARADAAQAAQIVSEFAAAKVRSAGRTTYIEIANRRGLAADEHPYARDIIEALYDAGVDIRAAVL
ncbi:MAG: M14 family zinc carboxypeptidase [Actinomycetota bacterium]